MKQTIPVVGKTCHYFDDGKIKLSRRSEVLITEVIPYLRIKTIKKNETKPKTKRPNLQNLKRDSRLGKH